jgi:hypothetical protein
MKRLTTLAAVLLSLTATSITLAAGGPGKFGTHITGKSAKAEHGRLDGAWTVDVPNPTAGKIKLTRNGQPLGGGKYLISGSTITITPRRGGDCKTKGKYHFKLSGSKLTFTAIRDICTVRRNILTYGPWTKVS